MWFRVTATFPAFQTRRTFRFRSGAIELRAEQLCLFYHPCLANVRYVTIVPNVFVSPSSLAIIVYLLFVRREKYPTLLNREENFETKTSENEPDSRKFRITRPPWLSRIPNEFNDFPLVLLCRETWSTSKLNRRNCPNASISSRVPTYLSSFHGHAFPLFTRMHRVVPRAVAFSFATVTRYVGKRNPRYSAICLAVQKSRPWNSQNQRFSPFSRFK